MSELRNQRKNRCFVDNSNLFVEGQRQSALRRGWVRSMAEAMDIDSLDPGWRLDYTALRAVLEAVVGKLHSARVFGSICHTVPAPKRLALGEAISRGGWQPTLHLRHSGRREKCVDVELASQTVWEAVTATDRDRGGVLLVAGDGGYGPLVDLLVGRGYELVVAFWSQAAVVLRREASRYVVLDADFQTLTLAA